MRLSSSLDLWSDSVITDLKVDRFLCSYATPCQIMFSVSRVCSAFDSFYEELCSALQVKELILINANVYANGTGVLTKLPKSAAYAMVICIYFSLLLLILHFAFWDYFWESMKLIGDAVWGNLLFGLLIIVVFVSVNRLGLSAEERPDKMVCQTTGFQRHIII